MNPDPSAYGANNPGPGQPPNYPQGKRASGDNYHYNPYGQNYPPPQQLPNTPLPDTAYGQPSSPPPPPGMYDPTVLPPGPSGIPAYPPPPTTPSYPGFPPYQPPPTTPQPPPRSPLGKILLIGLALLVILAGVGTVLAVNHSNQVAIDNQNATATTNTRNEQATTTARTQATVSAQATATYIASHFPFSSNLKLDDPLSDNSKGYGWVEETNSQLACQFAGGTYHAVVLDPRYFTHCFGENTAFSDFTYQVQMVITKGDAGGVAFRSIQSGGASVGYFAFITAEGEYILAARDTEEFKTLKQGTNPAIKKGYNQPNIVAIVARGNTFELYVNEQAVAKVTDSGYTQGRIGMTTAPLGDSDNPGNPTEAVFSNAKVWQL